MLSQLNTGTNARASSARPVATPTKPTAKTIARPAAKKTKPWQEVRKDAVERARKLLKNPDYPPGKVTKAVANLLSKKLQKLHDPASKIGI